MGPWALSDLSRSKFVLRPEGDEVGVSASKVPDKQQARAEMLGKWRWQTVSTYGDIESSFVEFWGKWKDVVRPPRLCDFLTNQHLELGIDTKKLAGLVFPVHAECENIYIRPLYGLGVTRYPDIFNGRRWVWKSNGKLPWDLGTYPWIFKWKNKCYRYTLWGGLVWYWWLIDHGRRVAVYPSKNRPTWNHEQSP